MTRRELLTCLAAAAGTACAPASSTPGTRGAGRIETVLGPIPPEQLGLTLMHEHVLVDFIGADKADRSRYDADQAFAAILPHLEQVRTLGCRTLVECTPAYLGRDAGLLRRLSEASGLNILSNTGYYGAANDKHLPKHAFTESADQLAARWIEEARHGLDGTRARPAFMKIGVDGSPLSDVDAKLVRAAAITCRETGLPIASHTSTGAAALEELAILDSAGIAASAFIWVHAHNEKDGGFHAKAAERGAWVEFDGISPASVDRHVQLVRAMRDQGRLDRVLVSHDAGWYRVGEPGGGTFRPYDTLFTSFIPALRAANFTEDDIRQLLVENPRAALSPR